MGLTLKPRKYATQQVCRQASQKLLLMSLSLAAWVSTRRQLRLLAQAQGTVTALEHTAKPDPGQGLGLLLALGLALGLALARKAALPWCAGTAAAAAVGA